ncbi:MAG: DNA-binding protein [Rhodoferax sp.]|nr:DNA-binding protein [Rhodoferax sp.]
MQSPKTRGIQYEDVAQAADALVHEGLRPTIERIRMHIGRGSPNTVSPMLEQWFSGLGQRLSGTNRVEQGTGALPQGLLQAAQTWWEAARTAAEASAAQLWAARQAQQDNAAQELEAARAQLQARELVLHERLHAMEKSVELSAQQLRESNQRTQACQETLAQRDLEISGLRNALVTANERFAALQQQSEYTQTQARDERTAMEARHLGNERRWLEEVDRARQEARKSVLAVQEQLRKNALLQDQLQAGVAARQDLQNTCEEQLNALRQELANAQGQAEQAKALLSDLQIRASLELPAKLRKPMQSMASRAGFSSAPPRRKLGRNRQ